MKNRNSLIAEVKRLKSIGQSDSQILEFLRVRGCNPFDSIVIIRFAYQIDLGNAKRIVHTSDVWKADLEGVEQFQKIAEEAFISSPGRSRCAMKTIIVRWQIEHEPSVTRDCYSKVPSSAGCDCFTCRNFMAASEDAFPAEFRAIAESLQIDPSKPAEIVHYNREESGLHFYGGWFHLVGSLIQGDDALQKGHPTLERLVDNFELGFSSRAVVVAESFRSHSLIQPEFRTRIPWVISDSEVE